jgi:hypothetical protein
MIMKAPPDASLLDARVLTTDASRSPLHATSATSDEINARRMRVRMSFPERLSTLREYRQVTCKAQCASLRRRDVASASHAA